MGIKNSHCHIYSMSDSSKTVHIDVTLELKDFFNAYFDAVKKRLMIAALIVAVVIGSFSYFFMLIGEQNILWQLSPLFFGFPIVAIVGQLLRVHASYRKCLADLSDSEKNLHYIFRADGDGFDVIRGKNFGHIAWESVRKVTERVGYFHFSLTRTEAFIIPKRFLVDGADLKAMRMILVSQLKSRAALKA